MIHRFNLAALFLALTGLIWSVGPVAGQNVVGGEKKPDESTKVLDELVALGQGVHRIKFDDKGRIQSVVVVGQARISTVFGIAKGLQLARQNARLQCNAEFVKWLKTKVSVHEKNEQETILFLEGKEDNDKGAVAESGKSIDKTTAKFESSAQGLIRGFQILGNVSDKETKTYTLVMGWSAKTAAATKKLRDEEKGPREQKKAPGASKDGADRIERPRVDPNKLIPNRKAVAPEFTWFVR